MKIPNDKILELAKKHFRVTTLETRNLDRLDFCDTAVWDIELALEEAYQLGYEAAKNEK